MNRALVSAARKSVALHIYAKGSRSFGMRKQSIPTSQWIDRFADGLGRQGFLSK